MSTVAWSVCVGLEAVALTTVVVLWLTTRRQADRLRSRVHELEVARPDGPVRRARRLVPRPEEAVRAVWETASLVRDKGVGAAMRSSVADLAGWAEVARPALVELAGTDGRVAILFSDIEGSTELNQRLGDRGWVRLLAVHDRVVRRQVDRHDGRVVKTQGDGFMVGFADAESAVRCAIDIQRALSEPRRRREPLAVRIGVHHGRVVHRDNDIFGLDVALAARVAALAEGGQVLVSEPVAALVDGVDDVELGGRREVELRGLAGDHVVTEVDWQQPRKPEKPKK